MKTTLRNFLLPTIICTITTNFSLAQESEQLHSLNQIRKQIERFSPIFKEEPILSKSSSTAINQLKKPVQIEVFLSPKEHFPQSLLHRRLSVLSLINQISETASGQVRAVIHEIEEHDPVAVVAEKLGVSGVSSLMPNQEIPNAGKHYFGAAVKGSLGKQIIPYLGTVDSLEKELVGSMVNSSTVKKKIRIFSTDAPVMGSAGMGFGFGTTIGEGSPPWEFVLAMKKSYEVIVIPEYKASRMEYDAMVVVQPSLLNESGIDDLVSLIKSGIPTIIFEDPLPMVHENKFPGTFDPPSSNPISKSVPLSKKPSARGDLSKLWKLLEVNFCQLPEDERKLVLSDSYNPFPVIQKNNQFPEEFVYVGGFENAFGSSVISKDVEYLLFNCSGFISPTKNSKLSFEPLVSSRKETGFTQADTFWAKDGSGNRRGFNPSKTKVPGTGKQQVIATKITGKPKSSASGREISVIVVSDTDFMADTYYEFARTPVNPSFPIKVQNSSFASGLIHHMAKNQNRFRSLDRKYVDPKVVSQFDSRIRSIREDYAPRVQAVDNSINSANQVVRGASIAFRDKDPKFSRAEMYLALQASKEKIIRLQRDKSRLIFERDELIKLLKESPFSGWIRVFGHNGHVRIERNYLSGEPHGMWKRMDASGKEVKSEKFLNKNPATNDFNENEFRTQRSMHLKKQKGQVERIRKLFAE